MGFFPVCLLIKGFFLAFRACKSEADPKKCSLYSIFNIFNIIKMILSLFPFFISFFFPFVLTKEGNKQHMCLRLTSEARTFKWFKKNKTKLVHPSHGLELGIIMQKRQKCSICMFVVVVKNSVFISKDGD